MIKLKKIHDCDCQMQVWAFILITTNVVYSFSGNKILFSLVLFSKHESSLNGSLILSIDIFLDVLFVLLREGAEP